MENKKKISLEITRKDGKTFLSFEVDESLEKLFKEQATEIKESQSWKGLKFYYVPEITDSQAYRDLLYDFNLVDNYGTPLYSNGGRTFNIAFIRTCGGKGCVPVDNHIPLAVVSQGVNNIISFLKKYYEEYLKNYSVKGYLNFEVQ